MKALQHQKYGELALLPVPNSPWIGISCDFVTDLPESNGYDSILVLIDRLTKMSHFIPYHKTTTAPQFAKLFIKNIVRLHELPDSIVSDRDSLFTLLFWKTFTENLGINYDMSTAFHPQMDGQTE